MQLTKMFKQKYPNQEINSILDLGDYYVVNLQLTKTPKDDFMLDNLYKVEKSSGKISGFAIDMDRKKYLSALKHPIYVRGKINVDIL